jgi:hypothetical protein
MAKALKATPAIASDPTGGGPETLCFLTAVTSCFVKGIRLKLPNTPEAG